jgi:GntR family transcriptional regulator
MRFVRYNASKRELSGDKDRLMQSPLYDRVKNVIRERIVAGVYASGSRVPSTSALAKEFAVSSITVRRAVQDLATEGKVVGLPGKGIYVTGGPRVVRSMAPNFVVSFGDELRRAGIVPSIKELSLSLVEPSPTIRKHLRTKPGGLVYLHEKVILADGIPVCFDRTHLPERLGRTLRSELAKEFLMEILVRRKIDVECFQCRMQSGSASNLEASVLGISNGAPVLKMQLMPMKPEGYPVFVADFVFRSEWFAFDFFVFPSAKIKVKASS